MFWWYMYVCIYLYTHQHIPVVPRKGVAEVSTIGNPKESLVVVNQGWQSEATDGSKGDWSLSLFLSLSLTINLPTYLPISLSLYLTISLSIYLNFQRWSDPGVFCTFWLANVLRATTACNFFISHLARWLRTRCFSEPTFRTTGATNHRENTVFRDFHTYLFAHLHLLSSASFSSLIFSLLLFSSLWLFPSKTVFRDFHTFSRICIFFLLPLSLLWSSLFYSSLWLFPSLLFICPYCRKFDS